MGTVIGFAIAIIIGICICIQPVFNNNASKIIGTYEAAFTSIAVTLIMIIMITLIFGKGDLGKWGEVPKYYYLAGVLGLIVVVGSMYCIQLLGPAKTISTVIFAQIFMSVILEHFGFFGVEQVSISLTRIIGVLLMIGGIVFIKGF